MFGVNTEDMEIKIENNDDPLHVPIQIKIESENNSVDAIENHDNTFSSYVVPFCEDLSVKSESKSDFAFEAMETISSDRGSTSDCNAESTFKTMSNTTPNEDNLNTSTSSIIQQLLSLPYFIHGYIIPPERIAILKLGRPRPVLKSLNKPRAISILKKTIKFESKIYIKNSWITGCSESERLYCWPCLLLAHSSTCTWNTEGHIPHTPNDALKHAQQDSHIIAEKMLSQILELLKSDQSNLQFKIVNNNIEILSALEIQETVTLEAKMENLKLANNAENSYETVSKLLEMGSVLVTKIISKQRLELARIGRPTPFLSQSIYIWMKVDGRYVKVLNEYIKTPWLAGCVKTDKLYCWPCTLFGLSSDISKAGHKYWTESKKNEHLKSQEHSKASRL